MTPTHISPTGVKVWFLAKGQYPSLLLARSDRPFRPDAPPPIHDSHPIGTIGPIFTLGAQFEWMMMLKMAKTSFLDADESGTLSDGDMVYINNNGGVEEAWNTVRLYSASAEAYSDENPTLPGFTGMLATLSLLGAAFVRRQG